MDPNHGGKLHSRLPSTRSEKKTGDLPAVFACPGHSFGDLGYGREVLRCRRRQVLRWIGGIELLHQQIRGFDRRLMVEVDTPAVRCPLGIRADARRVELGDLTSLAAA